MSSTVARRRGASGTSEAGRTVADDLARVVERLDEPADAACGREDVLLDLLRAVGEEDAEELEREEAQVEVRGREEGEEVVEGRGGREEDVGVAQARVVADRLRAHWEGVSGRSDGEEEGGGE